MQKGSIMCPLVNSEEKLNIPISGSNEKLISYMLGDASLSEKEIDIICKRKGRNKAGGLSSNEIMAYLYLKMHSCNGWYRFFAHSDFTQKLGISDRDIYHVLSALEQAKLIKVHGKKYSHFRDIHIFHVGTKKKARFLSLNRTYFRMGTEDYKKFSALSSGTKSMLLYLFYKENFRPDANGNIIEANVDSIARYMGLKKPTVINYIKEVMEVWPDLLIVQKTCYGNSLREKLSALTDRRIHYGAVISKEDSKFFTLLDNNSPGFWRYFDLWLKTHGIKERCIKARVLYDSSTHGTDEERMERNRTMLFNIIYAAASKGVSSYEIFKRFFQLVREKGFFDEDVTFYMSSLIPQES